MDNKYDLDKIIQSTLIDSVDKIDVSKDSFQQLKERIESPRKNLLNILKDRLADYKTSFKFNTKKAITSLACSLAITAGLCGIFVPSVRTAALNAIESYIYLPIKNTVGEFVTEKMPAGEVEVVNLVKTTTYQSDEAISNELGYTVKIPITLTDKYVLSEKWLVTGFKTSKNTFAAGVYNLRDSSEKAKLALSILDIKSEEYRVMKEARGSAEYKNQRELEISNRYVLYYESPILKGLEEIEKGGKVPEDFYKEPHEVLTAHTIDWEQDGIAYSLTDYGNNVSLEDMTAAVEEIINSR